MMNQAPTTHVIFDMCGTIIDTISIFENVFDEFAARIGKGRSVKVKDMIRECGTLENLLEQFANLLDLDPNERDNFINEYPRMVIKKGQTENVELCSGVEKLINHLYDNNIPMAIATNARKSQTDSALKNPRDLNLDKISHVVCGADEPEVKFNKPAPDVYIVCADRFKNKPKSIDNCVIFEDSFRGITGAVASGMKTVLINDMNSFDFSDISDKITVIVDSLDNFKPESVGLPPFKTR